MEKVQFQNLYNHPRLLYKFFPLSNEYACKYLGSDMPAYMFTPNIPRTEMESSESFEVIDKWRVIAFEGFIFYTSPIFFNDPFDTVLPNVPEVVPTIEERLQVIELLKSIHRVKKEDENRLLYSSDFDNALRIVLEKMGLREEIRNDLYIQLKTEFIKYREEIAVTCFSEVNNSKLMWAHYADNYKGFCIEYNFAKSDDIEFQRGIGKVIYTDERPCEDACEHYGQYEKLLLSTKAKCWSYEREWRSVNILHYGQYINKMYPIVDVKRCITAIYLGCRMPQKYQEEIARHYKDSGVKIYKMILKDNYFDFDFVEYSISE